MAERVQKFLCEEGKDELRFAKDLVHSAGRSKKQAWELVLGVWADSIEEPDKILQFAPRYIERIRRKRKPKS